MVTITSVFAVGSHERGTFVVDRIYATLRDAATYCDSRRNNKYPWVVYEVALGADWIHWKCVHRTECKS